MPSRPRGANDHKRLSPFFNWVGPQAQIVLMLCLIDRFIVEGTKTWWAHDHPLYNRNVAFGWPETPISIAKFVHPDFKTYKKTDELASIDRNEVSRAMVRRVGWVCIIEPRTVYIPYHRPLKGIIATPEQRLFNHPRTKDWLRIE
jgi:hypothetical protein